MLGGRFCENGIRLVLFWPNLSLVPASHLPPMIFPLLSIRVSQVTAFHTKANTHFGKIEHALANGECCRYVAHQGAAADPPIVNPQ